MPYMYSEMQNKLSKIRDSPLESMGQIISSRCPIGDREPIIVNISHESKSVGNSEAAIWQWMCLIG